MGTIVGIDLGTTNSAVAHLTADGPQIISNALGERLTPSVVGIDPEGKLLVGREAKELLVLHPDRCTSLFKRYMGSDWTVQLAGRTYTPEQLSGLVLRALKEDAEAHLGTPIERAVITVPAYFNDNQRKATMNAGRIAGLQVERILNEPTAAAMAYGLHEQEEEKVLVVLDLGGGTFDVSVVELCSGVLEVRASSGENFLGGEDFTRSLAARVMTGVGLAFERTEVEAPHLVSRMIQQAELAKCQLSRQADATLRVPDREGHFHDDSQVITVTREQFESGTASLLARMELPIRRALGDTNLKPADIDEVILVGGATRMPMFIERVTQMFSKPPRCRLNPDEVVALGAAVQAGLVARDVNVEDLVVTDVAPFTLGIETTRKVGHEHRDGYFLPIINRNTTIPVSRCERVATLRANQREVSVKIYQGEGRRVADNLFLGQFEVQGIPPGPPGQELDIRFTYDLNGVLEIEATIVETQRKVTHVVTRYARGLSAGQIAEAVAKMEDLKRHPREEAVNRFLIRRAERIYRELALDERHLLNELIGGFEQVLEEGPADAVERYRLELQMFLDRFDPGAADDSAWNDDQG
ncbi:MAG: Hsp70 family protein [Planctomycetes bacterium]|nr:Hsp70 family protein [Planctomycetota bacterium]